MASYIIRVELFFENGHSVKLSTKNIDGQHNCPSENVF